MKRKEYRVRQTVTFSAERDRYQDFEELCDKEHKSISFKLSEMIDGELQKNALGLSENPIGVLYNLYNNPNKSCQKDLTEWFDTVNNVTNQQELLMIKGQASHICNLADKRSMELHKQGIRK